MKPSAHLFILSLYLFLPAYLCAQSSTEDEYTRTFTYGININTNGGFIGGGNIKFTQIIRSRLHRSLGLEIVAIKHPQEMRVQALTNSIIFGKTNYLYSVRPTYGFDKLLFRKAPEESIQVMAHISAGPSIGIEVPYYIIVNGTGQNPSTTQPYQPTIPINTIDGTAGLFKGITEAKVIPALFVKTGISLEFGEFRNNITGLEAGFTGEWFSRTPFILDPSSASGGGIPISSGALKNKRHMIGAYVTLFLGSRK